MKYADAWEHLKEWIETHNEDNDLDVIDVLEKMNDLEQEYE
jgi:hypothetical protein